MTAAAIGQCSPDGTGKPLGNQGKITVRQLIENQPVPMVFAMPRRISHPTPLTASPATTARVSRGGACRATKAVPLCPTPCSENFSKSGRGAGA